MSITASQMRAARALIKMEQAELAKRSGVSVPTIRRMEGGDGAVKGHYDNVAAIIRELEGAGVIFVAENGEGPGVRLRKNR
ncbi:MAG: transcriptional regulator [Chelatococcus sp.]|nr:MAG: transcriptional regulator [Chelatococcus sp.]